MNNKVYKRFPISLQLDKDLFLKATDEEKKMQERMRESTTFWKDGFSRLKKNKIAMASLIIIIIITLIAIFVPMVYPYSYEQQLGLSQGGTDGSYRNLKPFEYGTAELER